MDIVDSERIEEDNTEKVEVDIQDDLGVDIIESACMICGGKGITRLMIHKIPNFRELIIASFRCNECEEFNNEVTFGGEIQLQGCFIELILTSPRDLNRQLIKSDSASLNIPHLEFEIPALTQKGQISTIEGFLRTASSNLAMYQQERLEQNPAAAEKVGDIILALSKIIGGDESVYPFTIIMDDPAGNSFIENFIAPAKDSHLSFKFYYRTAEQDEKLGLQPNKGLYKDDKDSNFAALMTGGFGQGVQSSDQLGRSEVIAIPGNCPNCRHLGNSLTAVTDIPHFKEVIIMAFNCEQCGFRNNEVKGGGAVPTFGTEVTLIVRNPEDLKRDVLKSDSSMVEIPELELELSHGTLGGVYTTVEGLLNKIWTSLKDNNPFAVGDSTALHHSNEDSVKDTKVRFKSFMDKLESYSKGQVFPFTLRLRDPLGNSFISAQLGSFIPPEMDTNLTIVDFERSYDDNEEFGLNDMNTKDFETGIVYETLVKADRLTHVTLKGADHPTFYAKGTDDDTLGGGVFVSTLASSEVDTHELVIDEISLENFAAIEDKNYGKRTFNDDSSLEFDAREEFAGFRDGFVYRLGSQGLGYYRDRRSA